jgi:hypothetical protein
VGSADRARAALTLVSARGRPVVAGVGGLTALVLVASAVINLQTFFGVQMPDPNVFAAFSTRETVPPRFVLQAPDAYESVLASNTMAPSIEADFLVPNKKNLIRPFDPVADIPYRGRGPGLIFLETEHDQALADLVAEVYPEAPQMPIQAPSGGKPIVTGFVLSPDVVAAHRGARVTYQSADGTTLERTEHAPALAASDVRRRRHWRIRLPGTARLVVEYRRRPHA